MMGEDDRKCQQEMGEDLGFYQNAKPRMEKGKSDCMHPDRADKRIGRAWMCEICHTTG